MTGYAQVSISPWGEKNFDASEASVRNSREGNVLDPLLSTSLTSSPEGGRGVVVGINSIETIEVESNMSLRGVDEVNDEAIHNSYGNQTQTAGLLHSVRNDMSGYAQESISPWGEKNFDASEASVRNSREGNVLAPNGDDTLTQNSNAHKFALNFHPQLHFVPYTDSHNSFLVGSLCIPEVEGSDNVILNLNSHAELVSASPIVANDGRFRNEFGMTDKSTSHPELVSGSHP